MIFIIILFIVIVFVIVIKNSQKNNVKYYIKRIPSMSDEEIKEELEGIVHVLVLHDMTVKRIGKNQADKACKYEKYGCKNYQEVIMFENALSAENDKRHLKA